MKDVLSACGANASYTVADIFGGRTCGPDTPDNLGSREYDRYREYLRQLIIPSRSRPIPTGANAGRPACVTRHRSRHGRVKHWCGRPLRSTDAECGRRCTPTTLRTVRRLPGRRGNDFSKANRRLGMLFDDWTDHPDEGLEP
ncbi:hypothetical protein EVAR_9765_1 [Eumeta japonica]|uniref:Uncharacterized protein n=1 Tax=Eumeta variegata TaxID=151549 RepID=A0A4C1U5P5_EUMVA|nr:hypothetical protein EVAR_9765_1 [Eumeta japonica]